MLRTIARNIVSNWMGYAINAVVIFFLTPFVLRSLGDTRYGVWILANGLTGYFGLLDLGFRAGTTQYLTRYLAQQDYLALNRTASTSVAALSACGVVVAVASGVVSWLAPLIFTIPEDTISEVRWCIAVIGGAAAIQFVFAPYSAVFTATQRYDIANAITILLRLATAAGTYVALSLGYGLLGLCAVHAAGETLGFFIRARVAYWILPQLHVSLGLAAWYDFRPILSYGVIASLSHGANVVRQSSSALIIGLFLPLAALAPFNLAASVVLHMERLFAPVVMVLFPITTQLDAQGDRDGLRRVYFAVSRMLLCGAVSVAMIGAIWAADFYRLWVGAQFVDGGEYISVVVLLRCLLLAGTVRIGQTIGHQVLLGCRAMRQLALLSLTEVLVSLVLMVPLIMRFGLLGVVVATLISAIVVPGVLFPLIVCRVIGARADEYFPAAYTRPCLVAAALAGPLVLARYVIPVEGSWSRLSLCGLLASAMVVPVLLSIGLNRQERRRLVVEPMRRIWAFRSRTETADAKL